MEPRTHKTVVISGHTKFLLAAAVFLTIGNVLCIVAFATPSWITFQPNGVTSVTINGTEEVIIPPGGPLPIRTPAGELEISIGNDTVKVGSVAYGLWKACAELRTNEKYAAETCLDFVTMNPLPLPVWFIAVEILCACGLMFMIISLLFLVFLVFDRTVSKTSLWILLLVIIFGVLLYFVGFVVAVGKFTGLEEVIFNIKNVTPAPSYSFGLVAVGFIISIIGAVMVRLEIEERNKPDPMLTTIRYNDIFVSRL